MPCYLLLILLPGSQVVHTILLPGGEWSLAYIVLSIFSSERYTSVLCTRLVPVHLIYLKED